MIKPPLLPGEVLLLEQGLHAYLLSDGRDNGLLVPADGHIFLTSYRVIFLGTPVDAQGAFNLKSILLSIPYPRERGPTTAAALALEWQPSLDKAEINSSRCYYSNYEASVCNLPGHSFAYKHDTDTFVPRISAHAPILAQCKVHRPWALFCEGTVIILLLCMHVCAYTCT